MQKLSLNDPLNPEPRTLNPDPPSEGELPGRTRRVVAIVGRPNVGKSAIFNRLARARVAIVHEQRGVTRDRLMREVEWQGERFELIDTGGLCTVDGSRERDPIDAAVHRQADLAIGDAAVVILVMDVESGITPLDEDVARVLRRSGCHVLLAANKADHAGRDAAALDFERFGFPVFPVAALHDRGFDALMRDVLRALPHEVNPTVVAPLRVAVVGRPNVGKSSFINALLQSDRVIVSEVPGTTRDSIDVPFVVGAGESARHYILTDTAGIRRLKKIDSTVERFSVMRAEKSIERAQVVVMMIDVTQGVTAQDRKIAALIMEAERGCVVLANKWDLLRDVKLKTLMEDLRHGLPFLAFCPLLTISAKTRSRMRESVEAIDLVGSQIRATLPTGVLNRTLIDACERLHAPAVRGRRLKIYYAAQTGMEPVRIRLFVNDSACALPAYTEYLTRRVRARFGLDGAPVRLDFKSRSRGSKKSNFSSVEKQISSVETD